MLIVVGDFRFCALRHFYTTEQLCSIFVGCKLVATQFFVTHISSKHLQRYDVDCLTRVPAIDASICVTPVNFFSEAVFNKTSLRYYADEPFN